MTLLSDASWDHNEKPCPYCMGKGYSDWELYKHQGLTECEYCEGLGYVIVCGECGNPLELVRPGKFQCNFCGW